MTETSESQNTSRSNIHVVSGPISDMEYSRTKRSENTGDVIEASKENTSIQLTNIAIDSADVESVGNNKGTVQGNCYIIK